MWLRCQPATPKVVGSKPAGIEKLASSGQSYKRFTHRATPSPYPGN